MLADFTNTTADPVFEDTLRRGLAIQLEQSPFLHLVSDLRIRKTLALMSTAALGTKAMNCLYLGRLADAERLAPWKDADRKIPIVNEARAEYAKLQVPRFEKSRLQTRSLRV